MIEKIVIRPLLKKDWDAVSKIYAQGIATGLATFETQVPDWKTWNKKYIKSCRIIAEIDNRIVGFAVLSKISQRAVYKGVAEVSVYVANNFKRQKIGETLLNALIIESEKKEFWTLQAGIFSENKISINLHKKCGFRLVGLRERIGQLNGKWHDVQFLERRSNLI